MIPELDPRMLSLRPGDRIRLYTPENRRLHGALARIARVTDWGAHVTTRAAATGNYRALYSEMLPDPEEATGDCCDVCGSANMRRAGSCLCCQDCGTTTGCS